MMLMLITIHSHEWKNISPFGENILSNENVFLLRVHRELVLVRVCVRGILWENSILNVILNFTVIRIFMLLLVLISWMFSNRLPKTTAAPDSFQLSSIHSPDLVRDFWLYIGHAKVFWLFNLRWYIPYFCKLGEKSGVSWDLQHFIERIFLAFTTKSHWLYHQYTYGNIKASYDISPSQDFQQSLLHWSDLILAPQDLVKNAFQFSGHFSQLKTGQNF